MSESSKLAPEKVIIWTLLFLGGVVMVIPFVYMLGASFKGNSEIYELSLLPRDRPRSITVGVSAAVLSRRLVGEQPWAPGLFQVLHIRRAEPQYAVKHLRARGISALARDSARWNLFLLNRTGFAGGPIP